MDLFIGIGGDRGNRPASPVPQTKQKIRKHDFDFTKREIPPLFENGKITDSAEETCTTIFEGFELVSSVIFLKVGYWCAQPFNETDVSIRIRNDLQENKDNWVKDKTSSIFEHFSKLEGLLDAIAKSDYIELLKIYYRSQHIHPLDDESSPFEVPICMLPNLAEEWKPHIYNAINDINIAAPGLFLYITPYSEKAKILIGEDAKDGNDKGNPNLAYTVISLEKPFIHLGHLWKKTEMKGTSIHELMHALGFQHEMQRLDAHLYLDKPKETNMQYKSTDMGALTRFDPFSIMMYSEDDKMKRKEGDPIWNEKPSSARTEELSELNKVALNIVYKPCKRSQEQCAKIAKLPVNQLEGLSYDPKISKDNEMLYCGRKVMGNHEQIGIGTRDDICGPNSWANCPTCRAIIELWIANSEIPTRLTKISNLIQNGRLQGMTGLFYCGKTYTKIPYYIKWKGTIINSDGVCGFDTGIPCTNCGQELYQGYNWKALNPQNLEEPVRLNYDILYTRTPNVGI